MKMNFGGAWGVLALVLFLAPGSSATCTGDSSKLAADQCAAWQTFYDATNMAMDPFPSDKCSRTEPCGCLTGGPRAPTRAVICSADGTSITTINLAQTGLHGTLPDAIGAFTELEVFNVASNALAGALPATITAWAALKVFRVASNGFVGALPPLPFAQLACPGAPMPCCQLMYAGSNPGNVFDCPWPRGAKSVCTHWDGATGMPVPITDSTCHNSTVSPGSLFCCVGGKCVTSTVGKCKGVDLSTCLGSCTSATTTTTTTSPAATTTALATTTAAMTTTTTTTPLATTTAASATTTTTTTSPAATTTASVKTTAAVTTTTTTGVAPVPPASTAAPVPPAPTGTTTAAGGGSSTTTVRPPAQPATNPPVHPPTTTTVIHGHIGHITAAPSGSDAGKKLGLGLGLGLGIPAAGVTAYALSGRGSRGASGSRGAAQSMLATNADLDSHYSEL